MSTQKIERQLKGLGSAIQRQIALRGWFKFFTTLLFGLVAFFLIDYLTRMPYALRLAYWIGGIGWLFYALNKNYLKPARRKIEAQEASLHVEAKYPELQSRLISTLQFESKTEVKPGVSEDLVEGMVDQTFDQMKGVKIGSVVQRSWQGKYWLILLIALGLNVLPGLFFMRHYVAYLQRLVLPGIKYPTVTVIKEVILPDRIIIGDAFEVKVRAEGILPDQGVILLESEDEREVELLQTKEEGVYSALCPALISKTDLTVRLGDDESDAFTCDPVMRPGIRSFKVKVTPPAYTGLEPYEETTGHLTVYKQSKLEYQLESTQSLLWMSLQPVQSDKVLASLNKQGSFWNGAFTVQQPSNYIVKMKNTDQLEGQSKVVYRLTIKPDQAPVVKWIKPKSSKETSPKSALSLHFEVQDDIRINRVRVLYRMVEADEEVEAIEIRKTAKELASPMDPNEPQFSWNQTIPNASLGLIPGRLLNIYVEVTDNAEPISNVTLSRPMKFTVLTDAEYKQLLYEKLIQIMGATDSSIDKIEEIQREFDRVKNL